MAKRGRKGLYDTNVKPYLKEIKEWRTVMTEQQIAEKLGIAYSTWNKYKTENVELMEALEKGRADLVTELRGALIKKAKGYQYTETKTTTEAVKWPPELYAALIDAGFTPEDIKQSRLVKTEVAIKEMPPDVAALNLSLKNYDKENWANDPQMLELRKKELELKERKIDADEW